MNEIKTWFDDMTMDEIDKLGRGIDARDFEDVFQVTRRGCVDGPEAIYAPTAYNEEIDDPATDYGKWTPLRGFTGQDSYNGAVMHASEFIGCGLAEHIIERSAEAEENGRPLLWTVVVVTCLDEEEDAEDDNVAGWATFYREV